MDNWTIAIILIWVIIGTACIDFRLMRKGE